VEALIGLGVMGASLQLSLIPILIAVRLMSKQRSGLAAWSVRLLLSSGALCAVVAVVLTLFHWQIVVFVLENSPLAIPLAITGVLVAFSLLHAGALIVNSATTFTLKSHCESNVEESHDKSKEAHQVIQDSLINAANSLGLAKLPELIVHSAPTTPAVTGLRQPTLIVPSYVAKMDEESRMLVLCHEVAHLKKMHVFWCVLASVLTRTVLLFPFAASTRSAVSSWAESEADEALVELEFGHRQITETRREVLGRMRSGSLIQPLAFVQLEDESSPSLATQVRRSLRNYVALATTCLGLAGAFVPLAPTYAPELFGVRLHGAEFERSFAMHFSDDIGNWTRRRYDIVLARAGQIYRMRGDGSGGRVISYKDGGQPEVSRDGSLIICVSPSGQNHCDLFAMDGEGGNRRQLTNTVEDEFQPSISPDGTQVVYFTLTRKPKTNKYDYGDAQIRLMNLKTGVVENLSKVVGPGIEPCFGPDGTYVLYTYLNSFYRLDLINRTSERIVYWPVDGPLPRFENHAPRPTKDGKGIFFNRVTYLPRDQWNQSPDAGFVNRGYTNGLWIMNADGSEARPLTKPVPGFVEQTIGRMTPTGSIVFLKTQAVGDAPKNSASEISLVTSAEANLHGELVAWISVTDLLRWP